MLLSAAWSFYYEEPDLEGLLMSSGITVAVSLPVWILTRRKVTLSVKDGFAIVTLAWFTIAIFSSLPFILTGTIPNLTDAFFESMSGITTTGASILGNPATMPHLANGIESLGKGVLFWRSFIQWIGGMGIIVFSIAILPLLGVGGVQLFKVEVPGPVPDKLKPRVQETAKSLWLVYLGVTAVEVILLMFGGMTFFDALCHSFTTMATGGFSTKNTSISHFNSAYVEYVIILFMFLAGVNFALHWKIITNPKRLSYFRDGEFKFYGLMVLLVTVFLAARIALNVEDLSHKIIRDSLFQVVSILTTTGFSTADYLLWGPFAKLSLLLLMFVGGCAGSTSGGMKIGRIMVVIKYSLSEIKRLLHPRAVIPVRIGRQMISEEVIRNTLGFVLFYVSIFVTVSVILTVLGLDLESAFGATAASIGNIGPGLGSVGPVANYAHLPALAKWLLTFCMLLGRLEIFTVMVFLNTFFSRR
ncbi:MAG TPA: TrkH family potassium uptake protein [Candidatus Marinimicrobia bacterium]|nr:TrkH family potassium uptake protein [Candidatus Neomarinimicrobiota bacterium]HIB03048.1 TrkH family potassium uptake protein [Candidatus Neomarinimicrobiota bacterium]HIB71597.1 TrkH family potassium uptake protein [Candidatus Neomarinimicrobiota bacterium]HIN61433.1 TrkH family potassium uptake protein [Candidatus Neomarinimicrobiota bacterium]HIO36445.1 TrkH family potassium uptake protein [Candidatus Neomarinimicrobiota bacterium]